MKNILAFTFFLIATSAHADFKSYIFPAPDQAKDPVTGKSPSVGLSKPASFALDMETAVKTGRAVALNAEQHGCNWASTSQVFAFSEGAIYTEPNSTTYNIFPRATALKFGCWLPAAPGAQEFMYPVAPGSQVAVNGDALSTVPVANYADLGYAAAPQDNTAANIEIPITNKVKFVNDMKKGVQISLRQHGCSDFAKKPYIYVFNDAIVYGRLDNSTFSVFTKRLVTSKGCLLPTVKYQAPEVEVPPFNFAAVGEAQSPFFRTIQTGPVSLKHLDSDYRDQKCQALWSWQAKRPYASLAATWSYQPNAKTLESKTLKSSSPLMPVVAKDGTASPLVKFTHFTEVVVTKFSPQSEDRRVRSADVVKEANKLCLKAAIDGLPRMYAFNPNRTVTLNDSQGPILDKLIESNKNIGNTVTREQMQAEIDQLVIGPTGYRLFQTFAQSVPGTPSVDAQDAANKLRYYVLTKGNSAIFQTQRNENGTYYSDELSIKAVYKDFAAHYSEDKSVISRLGEYFRKPADLTMQITWSCDATITPRELTLSMKEKVNPPTLVTVENYSVQSVDVFDYLHSKDSTKPIVGALKSSISEILPLYQYKTTDQKVLAALGNQPEQFQERRDPNSFVCSSADHMPSLVLDAAGNEDAVATKIAVVAKFNFLYKSIQTYMLSHSLVDYVKLGYCQRIDESCTYDKSPELAAMLKNFQALSFEKVGYLNTHLDGYPLTAIADFYDMSQNVTYPEYRLQ